MNILYCADSGLCEGIYLSTLSICRHTSGSIHFFLLTADAPPRAAIDGRYALALEAALCAVNPDVRVTLKNITAEFSRDLPRANMATRFTPLCMLRLYADLIDEIPDKILYLDADVLCRADLRALYEFDCGDADIAGVPDRYGKFFFGNIFRHDYLNSGVLLMNMRRIRKNGTFAEARRRCRDRRMFMPDQTALNRTAVKRKLPVRYNEQGKIKSDTVLKHFTTFFRFFPRIRAVTVKPWQAEKMHRELGILEFDDILEKVKRSPIV